MAQEDVLVFDSKEIVKLILHKRKNAPSLQGTLIVSHYLWANVGCVDEVRTPCASRRGGAALHVVI